MAEKKGDGGNRPDNKVSRDAGTGRFVTDEYAEKHPRTTVRENVTPKSTTKNTVGRPPAGNKKR